MPRYRMTIEYEGTRYRGWQAQKNARTVQGECEAALKCCETILEEEPALETAHCLAMRAHAALGNRMAVDCQFERCREALLKEINVSPSPQTEALYKALMQ